MGSVLIFFGTVLTVIILLGIIFAVVKPHKLIREFAEFRMEQKLKQEQLEQEKARTDLLQQRAINEQLK